MSSFIVRHHRVTVEFKIKRQNDPRRRGLHVGFCIDLDRSGKVERVEIEDGFNTSGDAVSEQEKPVPAASTPGYSGSSNSAEEAIEKHYYQCLMSVKNQNNACAHIVFIDAKNHPHLACRCNKC